MRQPARKRPRRIFSKLLLGLILFVAIAGGFWFGLIPQRLSPFSPVTLDERPSFFVDPKLSALRFDTELCQAVLKQPHIDATPIPDRVSQNNCGWVNAVRFTQTGGAKIGVDPLTCEMAAALTLWVEHEVQPLAREMFGQEVVRLGDMGTYDCRNIVGNPFWKGLRSQHAAANAIDISGFTFADGRTISLLRDWKGSGKESAFLREVHRRSCRYFRVALGPEFNKAHANHFHFDRGLMWTCR
ncbi:extensin family protein [Hyphomicrobium sp.]|uniref:extensin-like domain-containing protein n=1 Tax=Hyphomicrobium sp. TaxID=82 RepID=UPI0025BAD910|nr:extensin family protein [Hyphomicrobium sp.]MCC7252765.1 extensin family protein [Hyphomicrobium sp.]